MKAHQASDKEKITQYIEAMRTLNAEIKAQKARITELEKNARRVEELTKENSNLTTELVALYEHVERIKADAIAEFQKS